MWMWVGLNSSSGLGPAPTAVPEHWGHEPFMESESGYIKESEEGRFFFVFVFCLRQGFFVQPWLSWNLICKPGWPPTDRDLPVSASGMLG